MLLVSSLSAPTVATAGTIQAPDIKGLQLRSPVSLDVPPPGFQTSARQALAIAERTPSARRMIHEHPRGAAWVYLASNSSWEVLLSAGGENVMQVDVTASGSVFAVWTGEQVDAFFGQGNFAGVFDSPWVFAPFCLLFLAPFLDFRRGRRLRLLHLDLAVLLAFGVSYFLYAHANLKWSVPLAYPVLGYVLVRMLVVGLRPRVPKERRVRSPQRRLVPHLPTTALLAGVLVLVGARVALNIEAHQTIDVAYASVVGADRVWHGQTLYVDHVAHGDTYGPVTYLAYLPFERIFPWRGMWDSLPAAHAAALFFDLVTILGLFLLGRQLRAGPEGRRLGLALAWAWAAYPFTLLGLIKNTNDGLVAMLLVFSLLMLRRPAARGVTLGLAAAAKFFPAAILPLVAVGPGERSWRRAAVCVTAFTLVVALSIWALLPPQGVAKFWDATLGFQLQRNDPLSLWGLHPALRWLQTVTEVAAIGLAALAALGRRPRTIAQVSALAAAIVVAVEIPANHWFYFYIVWFLPFVLVALFAREIGDRIEPPGGPARPAVHATRPRGPEPVRESVLLAPVGE